MEFSAKLEGLSGWQGDMDALAKRVDAAARTGVRAAVTELHRGITAELSRTSHALGTPTPSRPGEPPSLITGYLRGSVRDNPIKRVTKGVYLGGVTPKAVYARIQELGGWAGRNHRSYLPPRPYIAPGVRAAERAAKAAFIREVVKAIKA
jgi:hypothetical protein